MKLPKVGFVLGLWARGLALWWEFGSLLAQLSDTRKEDLARIPVRAGRFDSTQGSTRLRF